MKFFALMMGAVRTSQTSLNFNVTTWRYIAERSKLHTYRRENTKSDTNKGSRSIVTIRFGSNFAVWQ
jgi:hypothetical protein